MTLLTTEPSTGQGSVDVHTQFIHNWSSLQAKWHFIDPESPIIDYNWAIGKLRNYCSQRMNNFTCLQSCIANMHLSFSYDVQGAVVQDSANQTRNTWANPISFR